MVHSKQSIAHRVPSQVLWPSPCDRRYTVHSMTEIQPKPAPWKLIFSIFLTDMQSQAKEGEVSLQGRIPNQCPQQTHNLPLKSENLNHAPVP
jgi:hypothetical protein